MHTLNLINYSTSRSFFKKDKGSVRCTCWGLCLMPFVHCFTLKALSKFFMWEQIMLVHAVCKTCFYHLLGRLPHRKVCATPVKRVCLYMAPFLWQLHLVWLCISGNCVNVTAQVQCRNVIDFFNVHCEGFLKDSGRRITIPFNAFPKVSSERFSMESLWRVARMLV